LTVPAPFADQGRNDYVNTVVDTVLEAAVQGGFPRAVTLEGGPTLVLGSTMEELEAAEADLSGGRVPSAGSLGAGSPSGEAQGRTELGTPDRTDSAVPEPVHLRRSNVMAGRIAVVTGAAQGFGENIAREFTRAGAYVVLADLNEEGAQKVANQLNRERGATAALAAGVDVSSEESVRELINTVVDTLGGIDLLISNAGVLKAKPVREFDVESFDFVTSVNYKGFFLCTKHGADTMALQNAGRQATVRALAGSELGESASAVDGRNAAYFTDIIQINSKSGLEGSNKNAAYAGSKFGGIGLVQSFAKELVEESIKVNAVCPGNFFDGPLWSDPETGLFVQYLRAGKVEGAQTVEDVKRAYEAKVPFGRGCRAEDVVRAIYYIVEQEYETGQAVPVTGGQVMMR
jgi:sorbitol-6-phosphate 2-dehydrogenase